MDQIESRLNNHGELIEWLKGRADEADRNRQEIKSRLLTKLDSIESVGQKQVDAIEALTTQLCEQAKKNELQDSDLKILKETVHGWNQSHFKNRTAPAVVSIATIMPILIELLSRYLGVGQ